MDEVIASLQDVTMELTNRLGPIIRTCPAPPDEVSKEEELVPLASNIRTLARRIQAVTEEIKTCINNLEL